MRRKAFERTGCLKISWLPNDIHNDKICPQGLKKAMFHVPTPRTVIEEENTATTQVPMDPEQAGILEEQIVMDENEEIDFLQFDDEKDNGCEIDDSPEGEYTDL